MLQNKKSMDFYKIIKQNNTIFYYGLAEDLNPNENILEITIENIEKRYLNGDIIVLFEENYIVEEFIKRGYLFVEHINKYNCKSSSQFKIFDSYANMN